MNGWGVRIIRGMGMVPYNNNRGGGLEQSGIFGEIENSRFLS